MRLVAQPARRKALAADAVLAGVTVIWGSTFVVNRLVVTGDTPPLLFLLVRFSLAGVVLFALARGRTRTPGLFADSLAIGGLTAVGIAFQLAGQVYTTASKAAFITGLSVPLTAPVAWLVTRKRPSAENLAGLAIATAGFAVMAWPREFSGVNTGDLLVLVTALAYAYIVVRLSEASGRHEVRPFAAGQIACAAATTLLLRLAMQPFLGRPEAVFRAESRPLVVDGRFVGLLLWMSLAATVVTFLLMTWAQARMSATHAAVIYALEPVFAALLAALLLGERLSGREAWGGALVLAGILVAELPLSRR
ncbi:MAG TPA: DMT family transporter [Thermoanaerobaculia bacterium]|nr:DMT family transporter [Thermoanaerobaculia bacterium]